MLPPTTITSVTATDTQQTIANANAWLQYALAHQQPIAAIWQSVAVTNQSTTANWYLNQPMQTLGPYHGLVLQNHPGNAWIRTIPGSQTTGWTRYDTGWTQPPSVFGRPPLSRRLDTPALIHSGRRALRRSLDLYRRLRGPAEIDAFRRGDAIVIRGARFRYRVKRSQGLLEHTMRPTQAHIPYSLHILRPDNDEPFASGCVVIRDTPVVDQLLAFALAVQDPEQELVALHTTNWSRSLPADLFPRLAA